MKKLIYGTIILLLITSCSPIKRHQRLVEKYPFVHTQDTVIFHDTLTLEVPKVTHDTVVFWQDLHDTIVLEKERLRVRIHKIHDSVYIEGECDSIYVERIVERKVPIRYYEVNSSFPWWYWLLIASAILIILYLIKNRKQ